MVNVVSKYGKYGKYDTPPPLGNVGVSGSRSKRIRTYLRVAYYICILTIHTYHMGFDDTGEGIMRYSQYGKCSSKCVRMVSMASMVCNRCWAVYGVTWSR